MLEGIPLTIYGSLNFMISLVLDHFDFLLLNHVWIPYTAAVLRRMSKID